MHKFFSSNKNPRKKEQVETRNNFYLSFFDDGTQYEEKEVNGFWLVKTYNPKAGCFQAFLYSRTSFMKYKEATG